jgi:hypothetical protein
LVAWTLSIFVSGKRIFRAKLAFLGTNGIVEFTLHIEQEQEQRHMQQKAAKTKSKEWLAWYSNEKHKATNVDSK